MNAFVTAGGGFLLAVLWFDLMFDVQVLGHRGEEELPEEVLGSIAAYYARVTIAARPMNRLIAAVMVGTLAAIVVEIVRGVEHEWVAWASLGLALGAIGLAGLRTVPSAVRLGARGDGLGVQSRMARMVLREHVFCAVSIAALVVLQLAGGGAAKSQPAHSKTELASAGHALAVDLDSGRYGQACNAISRTERARLTSQAVKLTDSLKGAGEAAKLARTIAGHIGPLDGCVGFLEFAHELARAIDPHARLGLRFEHRLAERLPAIRISGDRASSGGALQARYEDGAWRFEGRGSEPPFEVPSIAAAGGELFPAG